MTEFLLGAAGLVLLTVALGLVRVLGGPGNVDRTMAAQLLGTGGIAALLLVAAHALTKADNLGLGLIVLGLLPQADSLLGGLKLVAVWLLVQLGSATVAQLIAHALRRRGPGT